MHSIPHDKQMTVTLTAEEWNVVLTLMSSAQAPYRVSAPVIDTIQKQLTEQAEVADVS